MGEVYCISFPNILIHIFHFKDSGAIMVVKQHELWTPSTIYN